MAPRFLVFVALSGVSLPILYACGSSVPPRPSGFSPVPAAHDASMPLDAGDVDHVAVDRLHGVEVRDPFRWMERPSSRLTGWVDAQDRAARSFLGAIPIRADFLTHLLDGREQAEWTELPRKRGGKYFYSRVPRGHEKGVLLSFDPRTKLEKTVVDLDQLGEHHDLVVSWWGTSRDGHYAVFRMSPNGNDEVQARIFDLESGTWLPEHLADFRYSFASWDAEGRGFYYTWSPVDPKLDEAKRASLAQIRYHALRTDPAKDPNIREAPHQDGVIDVAEVSPDNHWLLGARWYNSAQASLWLLDRRMSHATWLRFTPDDGARYDCAFSNKTLYVYTQKDAPNGHVFAVDPSAPDRSRWREIIPERHDAILSDISTLGEFIVLTYLKDAENVFEVHRGDGSLVKVLVAPDSEQLLGVSGQPWLREGTAALSSYTQPYTPFVVHLPDLTFERFPTAEPLNSTADYVTEKVFYTSPDGTRAPIFLVRSKGTPRQQPAPLILHAYGAFGQNTAPGFRVGLKAWLDHGGVYADAVVRGGSEYGDKWHRDGMGAGRAKTYDDFIAASETLLRDGWTDKSKLVLRGGSAGGLLVSVAATERPELYAGVVAEAPITDMVRFPLFGNGSLWLDEFGSPQKASEFEVLLRHSPYHRVSEGTHYPPILVTSSADDDRVDPMHARKFVAALQAADPGGTFLLRTEPNAAHGGANTETAWLNTEADIYAFAFAVTHKERN